MECRRILAVVIGVIVMVVLNASIRDVRWRNLAMAAALLGAMVEVLRSQRRRS